MDSSTKTLWMGLFSIAGCLVRVYYYYFFSEISVFNAKSVVPDQMPHFAASDLGLHFLPITFFGGLQTKKG